MPIVHDYAAPADLIAQAALLGGQGSAGEDARRFDDQMAQRDRQFNLDYNARLMLAAQNDALQRQQNAATYDTNQQQIAAGIYGHQLQYDTNQQQIEQQAAGQQLQAQTTMNGQLASQMGQAARAHAKQNMELFMADRKAIMDARLNPAQFQAAKTKLQERYGIEWGMPEELMAQQDGAVVQQQAKQIQTLYADPLNPGKLLATPEEIAWMQQQGVPPDKIMADAHQRRGVALKQAKLQQDAEKAAATLAETQRKEHEAAQKTVVKDQQKVLANSHQGYADFRQSLAKYQGDLTAWEQQTKQWEMERDAAKKEEKTFTKAPPALPTPPMPEQHAGKLPAPQTLDEAMGVPEGAYFLYRGQIYKRGLGTNVEPVMPEQW